MKKLILTTVLACGILLNSSAQEVNIPDANFKAYLLKIPGLDKNENDTIEKTEAFGYIGNISCPSLNITSLVGIEAFPQIKGLYCNNNNLISLDLGSKFNLTELICNNNKLTSLKVVFKHATLIKFNAEHNKLKNIDEITSIKYNTLTEIKVTRNYAIQSINVTNCSNLQKLHVGLNQLKSLDLSKNLKLQTLNCEGNNLVKIDVTKLSDLREIKCGYNKLTRLDISKNTKLNLVEAHNNNLNALIFNNGYNSRIRFFTNPRTMGRIYNFSAGGNPNLKCIQVDDAVFSTNNWTHGLNKGAKYSNNCNYATGIKEVKEIATIYPNPTYSNLTIKNTEQIQHIKVLYIMGKTVKEFTGNSNQISVSELPTGTYILQVNYKNSTANSRFIKL